MQPNRIRRKRVPADFFCPKFQVRFFRNYQFQLVRFPQISQKRKFRLLRRKCDPIDVPADFERARSLDVNFQILGMKRVAKRRKLVNCRLTACQNDKIRPRSRGFFRQNFRRNELNFFARIFIPRSRRVAPRTAKRAAEKADEKCRFPRKIAFALKAVKRLKNWKFHGNKNFRGNDFSPRERQNFSEKKSQNFCRLRQRESISAKLCRSFLGEQDCRKFQKDESPSLPQSSFRRCKA